MATINHKTYNEATETFKDFNVYDGKETLIFKVDGSEGNVGIGTASINNPFSASTVAQIGSVSEGLGLLTIGGSSAGSIYFADGTTGGDQYAGYIDYDHPSDSFRFGTGGTERMRITSTGAVGIGTSSPSSKLQVESDSGSPTITLSRLAFGTSYELGNFNNSGSDLYFNGAANIFINADSNGDSTGGDRNVIIGNRGVESMRIDGSGNVGIGTASPSAKLHIGNSGAAAELWLQRTDGYNATKLYGSTLSDGNGFKINVSGVDALAITSTGNVGIGTDSPAMPLELVKNSTAGLGGNIYYSSRFIQDKTNYRGVFLAYDTSSQTAVIGAESGGAASTLAFYTYNGSTWAERAAVTSNGITFNGDTAAANALDDYEEGTWTPAIAFGGASVGLTYVRNSGTYTKVGRKVTVCGDLILSGKGSSTGSVTITGLPFVIGSSTDFLSVPSFRFAEMAFSGFVQGYGGLATTVINMENVTSGAGSTPLTHADFQDVTQLMVTLTYFV